jgi:hypothetical protein
MSWHHGTSVGMYRQRIVQRPCVHADIIIFCYTYIYIYIIHGHNDIWIYIRCLGIIVLPLGCIASASLQRSCIHKDINIFGYIQMHIYLYNIIYIYIYIYIEISNLDRYDILASRYFLWDVSPTYLSKVCIHIDLIIYGYTHIYIYIGAR